MNILSNFSEKEIKRLISEHKKYCAISGEKCRTEGHHLIPYSHGGTDDWSNAIYLSRDNHGKLHDGFFNGQILPCLETLVLESIGVKFDTELKEIDVVNNGGIGAGKRMNFFIKVPTNDFHVAYNVLTKRNNNDFSELSDIELLNRGLRKRNKDRDRNKRTNL